MDYHLAAHQIGELRQALNTVLSDGMFRDPEGKLRNRGFVLQMLVELTIKDPGGDFSPSHIAEILGAPVGRFRTQLTDLRQCLDKYYQRHSAVVVIRIPSRTAKPEFDWEPDQRPAYSVGLNQGVLDFFEKRRVSVSGIDQYLELGHSPDWTGWTRTDVEIRLKGEYQPPGQLRDMLNQFRLPPGRREAVNYCLYDYPPIVSDKGEPLVMEVQLGGYGIEYAHMKGGAQLGAERSPFRDECERLFQVRRSSLFHAMVCHATALTKERDGSERLLLCRRSPNVDFFPAHWSASFEEHMMFRHFDPAIGISDRHPFDAVHRGLESELDITVAARQVRMMSFGIE